MNGDTLLTRSLLIHAEVLMRKKSLCLDCGGCARGHEIVLILKFGLMYGRTDSVEVLQMLL